MMKSKFTILCKSLSNLQKSIISIFVLFFLLLLVNTAFFKNLVYESDDYSYHAIRTANYYLALKQGQFPVRWGPNLNQSYGYPSFNYTYHTPYFVGSMIHSFGFSIQQSLNLTVLFSIILGAFGCYVFVSSYHVTEEWKIILSLYFIINPYTLLNIYWRGAIGELFFYSFVPFFLLGIKKILNQTKKAIPTFYILLVIFTTALLALSHVPSLLLLGILTVFFILSEIDKASDYKKLLPVLIAVFLGMLLSSWYWIPAYFEQWMITYEKSNSFIQYASQFVSPISIFNITKSASSSTFFLPVLQIGFVSLLALVFGVYFRLTKNKVLLWYGLFLLAIFFLSKYSSYFWDALLLLKYIQYPWRFLWLITVAVIMLFIHFSLAVKISPVWKKIGIFGITMGLILTAKTYTNVKGTINRNDFDWYHPVTDTGSSFDEHQPIWSKLPYFFPTELQYVSASESGLLTTETLATYIHPLADLHPTILQFDGKTISYEISAPYSIVTLHKRLFYPGWEARVNGQKVQFDESIPEYSGILALQIAENQTAKVEITFTGYTKVRRTTELLSLGTLLSIALYCLLKKLWQNS